MKSNPTFAECFCAKHNIPREKFARAVFNRSLYKRTHLIKWWLPLLNPNYFAADFDLIYGVENLRRTRDFVMEAERFNAHPANHGWMRRTFCFRISTSRLKAVIRETLPRNSKKIGQDATDGDGTMMPFEMATPTKGV